MCNILCKQNMSVFFARFAFENLYYANMRFLKVNIINVDSQKI